ncbi:hypothetical protein J6590_007760 [Homalodisca vitripennis]|nr:hypothetical protein J6590_007760 [Homalodisca vitripennis]
MATAGRVGECSLPGLRTYRPDLSACATHYTTPRRSPHTTLLSANYPSGFLLNDVRNLEAYLIDLRALARSPGMIRRKGSGAVPPWPWGPRKVTGDDQT